MVLLVSVVAVWLARDPNSLVLSLVSYAWAGFGCGLGPSSSCRSGGAA